MLLTTILKNSTNDAMKAMALALFPYLTWRHHGIGCLQGYVVEDREPEVRLHIWSPRLLKPGMDVSGDIHDHRFNLVSHVLCGVVGHEEIVPKKDPEGRWTMLALTHARAAKDSAYHGPTTLLPGKFSVHRWLGTISEGYSYRFPAGNFHRSPIVGDIAVTCVEKHNQLDTQARLLYPTAVPPVMAFGHEMDHDLVTSVLRQAREALTAP